MMHVLTTASFSYAVFSVRKSLRKFFIEGYRVGENEDRRNLCFGASVYIGGKNLTWWVMDE